MGPKIRPVPSSMPTVVPLSTALLYTTVSQCVAYIIRCSIIRAGTYIIGFVITGAACRMVYTAHPLKIGFNRVNLWS